jgi:hypothetical protein
MVRITGAAVGESLRQRDPREFEHAFGIEEASQAKCFTGFGTTGPEAELSLNYFVVGEMKISIC